MEAFLEENEMPNLMIYSKEKSFVPDYIRPKKIVEDEYIDLSFMKNLKLEEINEGVKKNTVKQGEFISKFQELPKTGYLFFFSPLLHKFLFIFHKFECLRFSSFLYFVCFMKILVHKTFMLLLMSYF